MAGGERGEARSSSTAPPTAPGVLVNHPPLCLQQSPVRGQPFPVAGAFDDDLVAGVGQPVQGAVAQDGVVEEAQPFLHGPVAGDDKAGDPVAVEDEFVEVCRLLGGEPVESQIVQDKQVRGQEGPEGSVHRVVDSGLAHGPEEVVRVDEADGVSRAYGGEAQGLGYEALAPPRRVPPAGRPIAGRNAALPRPRR